MRRSIRLPLRIGALAVTTTLLSAGCGQNFSLPPQPEPGRIPTPGTFNLEKVWLIPSPTDVVLQGSYVYVIEEEARLNVYLSRQTEPRHPGFIGEFEGLVRPVQVCLAKRDSTFLFVADAGDRTVKRFYFRGGPPLFTFSDSAWVEFSGLAADSDLNVYVADAARDTVYQYDERGRPVRLVSDFGTGQGFVIDPHGLAYSKGALWVADTGKNWVQRLRPDSTNTAFEGKPIGLDVELREPVDVAASLSGEAIFVAEEGNDRVLRFQKTGGFQDTVYAPTRRETRVDPPLRAPRYLAADDSLVFLPDPENDRILVLRLAQQ
jgi:DNA-binding beta-propeller fold protein YncE